MAIKTRIERMKLKDLKLLPSSRNAQFMKPETFKRLIENIRQDGVLTSVPLAWKDPKDGKYVVLSGNHRTMAAIEAGIEEAEVMLTDDPLPDAKRMAIQLSHNALVGESDVGILKTLWAEIDDLEAKMYAGLDDKTLQLLEDPGLPPLVEIDHDYTSVSFLFLPEEAERLQEIIEKADKALPSKQKYAAPMAQYDGFMNAIRDVADLHGVRNAATILMLLVEMAEKVIEDLVGTEEGEDG